MTEYNGHPSWEHWNVSLWVCNDEPLYRMARAMSRRDFIEEMMDRSTPDGAEYTAELADYAWGSANEE